MYRNEDRAAELRAAQLQERVTSREAAITDRLHETLPRALAERLAHSRENTKNDATPTERVTRFEAYDAVLDEVFALAPHLEADLNALPVAIDPGAVAEMHKMTVFRLGQETWHETSSRLPSYLRELDGEARIEQPKQFLLDATLTYRDTPIGVRMQPEVVNREYTGEVELALATPVRLSTAHLDIRPLAFAHSFTKLLRIHRDVVIGEEEIDGRFLIQGDVDLIQAALGTETRRDMLKIAEFDVPHVGIHDVVTLDGPMRIARIRWRWDAKIGPLRAGLRILARLRQLDTRVSLTRREPG